MQQFNLDKWLQDKSRKVVTRDGREVEIVKYDMKGTHFPVLYVISNKDGSQEPCECSKSGMCQFDNIQSSTDLFFADEEEELTEIQKTLEEDCDCYVNLYNDGKTREELREWIKCWCHRIIDLARKELEANYYTKVLDDRMVFKSDLHARVLQGAYEMGKQDALKDLPKWKDVSGRNGAGTKDYEIVGYYLVKGNYAIYLKDLEKLPK